MAVSPHFPDAAAHARLIADLKSALGAAAVLDKPEDLLVYECDAFSVAKYPPSVVVLPASTEQVSAVVKLANKYQVPYVARGAGTGLSGGATPVHGGIMLSLAKLNRVLEIDVANRIAVVQPGVVNLHVSQTVAADNLFFAPDPSSQAACSIGGNVAENSGGPHTLKHGVMANHVLGLEMVDTTGEIVRLGGRTPDFAGYDLVGLVLGSEGTLGIVTEVTLKLLPKPETVRTLLAVFADIDTASRCVSSIIADGMIPVALEMMDRGFIRAVDDAYHFGFPEDAGAVLIIELDGVAEIVEADAARVAALAESGGAASVRLARDEAERLLLWKCRKSAFGAIGRMTPSYLTQDGVVPRSQLPHIMKYVAEVSRRTGLTIANVFHAGDGNIHPVILFDERDVVATAAAVNAGFEIIRECVRVGGCVTGEHGVGVEKSVLLRDAFTTEELAAMQQLKAVFDPDGRCNPGKVFPPENTDTPVFLERDAAA